MTRALPARRHRGDAARLIFFLVDGLPYWLLRRLAHRRDEMVHLFGAFAAEGTFRLEPAFPNCQTPPSLASLWTGSLPDRTGIDGFDLPDLYGADPLACTPAFRQPVGHLRWLWDWYAERGVEVRLSHVPFVETARLGRSLRRRSYGFTAAGSKPRVIPAQAAPVEWRSVCVEPGWHSLGCGRAPATTVRRWLGENGDIFVELGTWVPETDGDEAQVAREAVGAMPMLAEGLSGPYRRGELGRPLIHGGSGMAEDILVSGLEILAQRYYAEFLHAVASAPQGLVIGYQPACDLLFHDVIGLLAPVCRHFTPDRADRVEELVARLLRQFDAFLGVLKTLLRAEDRAVVCSDHGMMPLDTVVYPNTILRRIGLLAVDPHGGIALDRTACLLHPCESGLFCFVRPELERRNLTIEIAAHRFLHAYQDMTRGSAAFLAWDQRPDTASGITACHVLRPGFGQQLKATLHETAVAPSRKTGEHGVHLPDPHLEGIVIDLNGNALPHERETLRTDELAPMLLGEPLN